MGSVGGVDGRRVVHRGAGSPVVGAGLLRRALVAGTVGEGAGEVQWEMEKLARGSV